MCQLTDKKKLNNAMGLQGSEVRILSPRPLNNLKNKKLIWLVAKCIGPFFYQVCMGYVNNAWKGDSVMAIVRFGIRKAYRHHCLSHGTPSPSPSILVSVQCCRKYFASAHEVIWEQCCLPSHWNTCWLVNGWVNWTASDIDTQFSWILIPPQTTANNTNSPVMFFIWILSFACSYQGPSSKTYFRFISGWLIVVNLTLNSDLVESCRVSFRQVSCLCQNLVFSGQNFSSVIRQNVRGLAQDHRADRLRLYQSRR